MMMVIPDTIHNLTFLSSLTGLSLRAFTVKISDWGLQYVP